MIKRFPSVPGSFLLPCIYLASFLTGSTLAYGLWVGPYSLFEFSLACGFTVGSGCMLFYSLPRTACVIHIFSGQLVCKIPFHKDIIIEYEKCNVGMDYHIQNGKKIWWIYFCYGQRPSYNSLHHGQRINSIKCQDGFVRMMYREDIYTLLLDVLPKNKRIALVSARKFADID